ncbi:hypothetical protein EUX98_g3967 [Antrodiella citrinella]|uniref:AB hydrolase-1 domain-containing protein n=1 Tax=Antrodiella citrinella TaxID=2447956 RepID=A0A4V3XIR8_9APHY|nr:hypothetical protein EUX98_g3967 [Antrodiella citrinella]
MDTPSSDLRSLVSILLPMAQSCKPSFEGTIPFPYHGETFQTFVKVYGDLKNRVPLVALHGGPGVSHHYLACLSDLTSKYDFPVIVYDQIGNAGSTHLPDKPKTFWSIDLFIDELENLLSHFGISDEFSLLGQSWGGCLAMEFEVRRQPKGLKKVVLANSLASFALWEQSTMELAMTLPPEVGAALAGGMANREKYWEALQVFHSRHGCIVKPPPKEYYDSILWVFGEHGDTTVADAEILKGWTIIDRLHLIKSSAFIINGRKDIAQDFVVKPLFDGLTKVKWVTFEGSSHTPHLEERDKYMKLVAEFLQ